MGPTKSKTHYTPIKNRYAARGCCFGVGVCGSDLVDGNNELNIELK